MLSLLLLVSLSDLTTTRFIGGGSIEAAHAVGPNDAGAEAETAAAAAAAEAEVAAVVADLTASIRATEERLSLCKRSLTEEQQDLYPDNVIAEVRANPNLGTTSGVLEICQAYLTGRVDAKIEERQYLNGLLN